MRAIAPDQCAADIMTVMPAMMRWLRAEIRHHGQPQLSLSQLRVLYFLDRKPQSSLSEVADYLDVTRPTMSAMIERLVLRGLVHRIDDPSERRRVLLTLTESGSAEKARVYDAALASVAHRLGALSDQERQHISAGLALLSECFTDS
jgi:DNA-binding MarR family transcriptional regulator